MTTPRKRRGTLLLPEAAEKPPKEVAEVNDRYADALHARAEAGAKVRDARNKHRAEKGQDAAPATLRKLEHTVEDAEHELRSAKRSEHQAKTELVQAIKANKRALIAALPFAERDERIRSLIEELATELDQQAEAAGFARGVRNITNSRTQNKGFTPVSSQAGRGAKPTDHIAALASWATELRQIGEEPTEPTEPTAEEEDFQRRQRGMKQMAAGGIAVHE